MTDSSQTKLKRSLGPSMLVLYGLGTVVGAGIYAVIGEVAANAGLYTPLAFLVAGVLALFSAMSLGELSARFPKSAGEAVFVREGFGISWLSTLVGLLVVLSGIVSAATIINGAVGYVNVLFSTDRAAVVIGLSLFLGLVASMGVRQSVGFAGLISVVEVMGLLLVIGAGFDRLDHVPDLFARADGLTLDLFTTGILGGALLAFYAFIGFEDMVNMAEEVKDPVRTMPRSILIVLVLSSILYVLLGLVLVASLDMETLRQSKAPLADVFQQTTGLGGNGIALIGILAILNGGLVQIIMGARVLYGLSNQGSVPKVLGRVSARTQTPVLATVLVTSLVLGLALYGTLGGLASLTSMLLLVVFALVNGALLRVKARGPGPEDAPNYPVIVPLLGMVVSAGFVIGRLLGLI